MRQSGILVGIVMVLASWASASSMDAGDGFDELTTRIRQVCRYSPNESWSLVNDAEALLTPESSFASRVELILARAPATAMRKGYDSALGEVLDLIDEALAHGDTEDWIPRIRTAAADLACRHGSFLFGFEQFLEGLKWVDSKTRRSTRLMLLEQGTRISLMLGMPHLSWDILKEFDSLDGYIDPDCRPVGLILKAEVEGAMGDLDGMNQTIEELELAKGVHFQDELLKQFWVLKVKYSLLKGRLGVAARYLNEAHGTSTPLETDCVDGLMYWYHAVAESLKGSGED
jgi:hypothetical protein